jgi:hypothetical protein
MITKNIILDKILKIYFLIFALFSIVATNIVLNDILIYYDIYNKYTSYIVLLITIPSFICMLLTVDKWNYEGDNKQ